MKIEMNPRVARFATVGAINTIAGYALYFFALCLLRPASALAVATVIIALFNYFTYSRIVFEKRGRSGFIRFIACYIFVYLANVLLLFGLVSAQIAPRLAQLLVLPLIIPANYSIQRFWVFRPLKEAS